MEFLLYVYFIDIFFKKILCVVFKIFLYFFKVIIKEWLEVLLDFFKRNIMINCKFVCSILVVFLYN